MLEHAGLWDEVVRVRTEELHREADRWRLNRRGASPRRPIPRAEPTER